MIDRMILKRGGIGGQRTCPEGFARRIKRPDGHPSGRIERMHPLNPIHPLTGIEVNPFRHRRPPANL